ncbi:hypothetical protein FK531_19175 [Rhodococcus spelaei]|uniref:Serine/threonine protein kinase n=1 Tax=Rhodococcus spelaei TaxID=2546320 RepID=A0A541B0Z4_9NOCA|nr:hypothetical protein [Rhodococcus spelaei]TQF65995.1 hypothetical protein FK531_19175 [Rhodococcus spelaei]
MNEDPSRYAPTQHPESETGLYPQNSPAPGGHAHPHHWRLPILLGSFAVGLMVATAIIATALVLIRDSGQDAVPAVLPAPSTVVVTVTPAVEPPPPPAPTPPPPTSAPAVAPPPVAVAEPEPVETRGAPGLGVGGTDSRGFVNYSGARCSSVNSAVAVARTSQSLVTICQTGAGRLSYRAVRLSDGATIELGDPLRVGDLFVVRNGSTSYSLSPVSLVITRGTTLLAREPMLEFASR